jgi:hypothetical protein
MDHGLIPIAISNTNLNQEHPSYVLLFPNCCKWIDSYCEVLSLSRMDDLLEATSLQSGYVLCHNDFSYGNPAEW